MMKVSELKTLSTDLFLMYELITNNKDTEDLKELISSTSGMLTKLGYKVHNEYKIDIDKGLPYKSIAANSVTNIETGLGIRQKSDVNEAIECVKKLITLTIEIQRWYPANLKKYANRASIIGESADDPAVQAAHLESIKVLNQEQKCQAYLCKMIVMFLELADLYCARVVATFKSIL
jgi:hypothetical protein